MVGRMGETPTAVAEGARACTGDWTYEKYEKEVSVEVERGGGR